MDSIVSARRHVNILAIAGLFFFQMALDEIIDSTIEIDRQRAIMLRQNILGLDWLREVRCQNVIPVSQKWTLEYILELDKTLLVTKVDFCASTYKGSNGPQDSKLGAKLTAVCVDFSSFFLTVLVATQLVGLWEFRFLVPGPFDLEEQRFFKDAGNSMVVLALKTS